MLHIVTALHFEAKPLIDYYGLRKLIDVAPFDVFANDQIKLIVSGIGRLNAAIATTFLRWGPGADAQIDLILNLGVCGTTVPGQIGQLFHINRIIDRATQNSFIPEMFIKSNIPEKTLETWDRAVLCSADLQDQEHLVDMEAYAVCEAASKFSPLERVQCLKIPSDTLKYAALSGEFVHDLIWQQIPAISNFIDSYSGQDELNSRVQLMSSDEMRLFNALQQSLRLTQSQRHTLLQRIHAYKICVKGGVEFLNSFLPEGPLNKEARKALYREILNELSAS